MSMCALIWNLDKSKLLYYAVCAMYNKQSLLPDEMDQKL